MKKNQTVFLKLCLADALIKLMKSQSYDSINVNAVCAEADVGRTTFYRHFGNKNSKEEILRFKAVYEWETYKEKHEDELRADKTFTFLNFIYENKKLFALLDENGVTSPILCLCENLSSEDYAEDKASSYLKSFFVYGQFGVINQWIKYGFDETPEQIRGHIVETVISGIANKADFKI